MKQHIVDAFFEQAFHGNRAGGCVLKERLSEDLMLNLAQKKDFSETDFMFV